MQEKKTYPAGMDTGALRRMNRLCQCGALLAVAFTLTPYFYTFFFADFSFPRWTSFLLTLLFLSLGEALMALFARLFRFQRNRLAENSYEPYEPDFHLEYAILPFLLCAIGTIPLFQGISAYLRFRAAQGLTDFYSKTSLTPYLITLVLTGLAAVGIVLWFFPFNRIVSSRTFFPMILLFVVHIIFTRFFSALPDHGGSLSYSSLCLCGYLACALLLLNQAAIQRHNASATTRIMTSAARRYNFGLVLFSFFAMLLTMSVAVIAATGIIVTVKLLFYRLILHWLRLQQIGASPSPNMGEILFGGVSDLLGWGIGFTRICYLLFLLLLGGIFTAFLLSRRHDVPGMLRDIALRLLQSFFRLFYFLYDFFSRRSRKKRVEINPDYRDEELRMDETCVRAYTPMSRRTTTFREFQRQLSRLPDDRARLQYAYSTLVRVWKTQHMGITESDTPREIMQKVIAHSETTQIAEVTHLFETVHYANAALDPLQGTRALEEICRILRRYFPS